MFSDICLVTSVMSDSLRPHGPWPARLLCPWDSPGKNTGVGCHFLLQCMKVKVKSLSHVQPSATPWTAAFQAPLSMGFSRQEYWSGVPLPSPMSYLGNSRKKLFEHIYARPCFKHFTYINEFIFHSNLSAERNLYHQPSMVN